MAQALLSDADLGIGAASAPAQNGDQHLSDADVGLSPAAQAGCPIRKMMAGVLAR
jgi:hypothetical protein